MYIERENQFCGLRGLFLSVFRHNLSCFNSLHPNYELPSWVLVFCKNTCRHHENAVSNLLVLGPLPLTIVCVSPDIGSSWSQCNCLSLTVLRYLCYK